MNKIDGIVDELIADLVAGVITIDEALNNIDKLILIDTDLAWRLIDEINKNTNLNNNIMVNYVANKIREKRFNDEMCAESRINYENYLKCGLEAFQRKKFQEAFQLFSNGYESTKHSVFIYYMGKSLYYMGKINRSSKYFYEYIALGSEKFLKANLYLWSVAKKRHYTSEADYRMAILYYTPRIFESEAFCSSTVTARLTYLPDREKVLPTTFKVVRKHDLQTMVETTDSGLAASINEEYIVNFNNLEFNDQLNIIHQFYSVGNIVVADRLIKEAEISASGNPRRQRAIKYEKGQRHVYAKRSF